MENTKSNTMLSNAWYDRLKFLALVVLPALGSLYFGLAQIWNLPKAEEVVGTVTVLDTFLGILLQIGTNKYNNSEAKYSGTLNVYDTEVKKVFTLELNVQPEDLEGEKEVLFKVNNPAP